MFLHHLCCTRVQPASLEACCGRLRKARALCRWGGHILKQRRFVQDVPHIGQNCPQTLQVVFLATGNSLQGVPSPLLDRLEVIRLAGYTLDEKVSRFCCSLITRSQGI